MLSFSESQIDRLIKAATENLSAECTSYAEVNHNDYFRKIIRDQPAKINNLVLYLNKLDFVEKQCYFDFIDIFITYDLALPIDGYYLSRLSRADMPDPFRIATFRNLLANGLNKKRVTLQDNIVAVRKLTN